MAREDTLVHQFSQREPLRRAVVETTAYDATKDCILHVLREMFARHPEYVYVPDPHRGFDFPDLEKTKIQIWQDYPYETLFLPCITINVGSFRDHPVGFNQKIHTVDYWYEQGNVVYNEFGRPIPLYFEYAGAWDISFNININAQSPWDRDLLADFVTINFMHIYRDWLYTRGIHVKTLSNSGESQVDWRNEHVYKLTTSLDLYTEWTHRIPYPRELLERFGYSIHSSIARQPLVPDSDEDPVERVDNFATTTDEIPQYLDLKPASAMDTVVYNEETQQWEIEEEWWLFIGRYLSREEIATEISIRYEVNTLEQLVVEDWLDILANISSPARLGSAKVLNDVQVGIKEAANSLRVDADGDFPPGSETTELNRLIQLRNIYAELEGRYQSATVRYNN